jgi:hypothetical protein
MAADDLDSCQFTGDNHVPARDLWHAPYVTIVRPEVSYLEELLMEAHNIEVRLRDAAHLNLNVR